MLKEIFERLKENVESDAQQSNFYVISNHEANFFF